MRSAEYQREDRRPSDLPLLFRTPHAALRTQGSTLSFLNRKVRATRPTNRDLSTPVTCLALCSRCTPASALTVNRARASSAPSARRSVRCTTPARNVGVVSYAATGG